MVFKKFKNLIRFLTKCHSTSEGKDVPGWSVGPSGDGQSWAQTLGRATLSPGGMLAIGWFVTGSFIQQMAGQGSQPALSLRGAEAGSKDRPAVGISGAPNRPEIRVKEEGSGRADSGAKAAEKVCVAKGPRTCRRLFFQRFAGCPGKFS